jgi:predicted unusual protein kinase regulating ubiquinone biosynthesis (AarF/ABC1/UbiB family)
MFQYLKNLYNQITKIYKIKNQLNIIQNALPIHENINELLPEFNKLKQMIFNCGSIYIKFLQWYISKLKANIIDEDTLETRNIEYFVNYFEDIFENCPFHSIEHTKEIFKNALVDIELDKYVDITTLKEIASGSIGQVYYAIRKSDRLEIAIKVKHPDITSDLKNQLALIKFLQFLQSFKFIRKHYNLIFNIDDFMNDILQQCDFCVEANNNKQFRENFKDSSDYIVFPEILFQSEDILISNYIPGQLIDTLSDTQKNKITTNFVCFFNQMLLVDNFIHGDLHCKNWKVRIQPNGKPQLIIYDCGICFKNINLEISTDFWFSLAKYDKHKFNITIKKFIQYDSNLLTISNTQIDYEIDQIFNTILKDSLSTTFLLKSILHFFTTHNITVHKFLLNFSILICVIEEFFKKGNIINKESQKLSTVSMFNIINDGQLDIISFCQVNKCYPKVCELFIKELDNKFIEYKNNVILNNINENKSPILQPILFSNIALSGLVFKPPQSENDT